MVDRAAALSHDEASPSDSQLRASVRPAEIAGAPANEPGPEAAAPRRLRAALVLLTGADAGRTFALDADSAVLGRDPSADVQVAHATVSRHHARVWRTDDGRYFLEDLGSANCTAISSRRVQRVELRPNDRLQLGPYVQLRFELSAEDPGDPRDEE